MGRFNCLQVAVDCRVGTGHLLAIAGVLLYRFGGVVVIIGFAILFFQEVDPVGRGVVKEVGEYPVGGPDPAKVLIP